jgi:hypothetical protein
MGSITDKKPPKNASTLVPKTKANIFTCFGFNLIFRIVQAAGIIQAIMIPETPPIIP